jgi:hypothetical protein
VEDSCFPAEAMESDLELVTYEVKVILAWEKLRERGMAHRGEVRPCSLVHEGEIAGHPP